MNDTKMRIESKHHYYQLYNRCHFGNRPRNWAECQVDEYPGPYMARSKIAGGVTIPTLSRAQCTDTSKIYSEQMPDHAVQIQGEYLPPLDLVYSTVPLTMKEAFKIETLHMRHTCARVFIKERMCAPARERFDELIDEHGQDAIIEFSIYNQPVGILQWNTIIWEVRNY